ncbi:MAG: T9SS type A sorting domain-containing protein [Melioribacteraceae bacterium]|nr:T9SS type A sorting domain-containing protein [Melioribacteraceae bacterium]
MNTAIQYTIVKKNLISKAIYKFLLVFFLSLITITKIHGQSWTQVAEIDTAEVFSITEQNQKLFVVTPYDIYVGTEKGNNWSKTQSQPENNSYFYTIYSYQGNLYLGTYEDGIFRSTDSGESWQKINDGLSQAALGIVEFAGRGDSLFVGTDNDGIYYLNLLQAASWEKFNSGLFQFGSGAIFSSGDFLLANLGMYLFMNTKNKNDWQNIFVDTLETQRQFFDFLSHDNFIFAGTDNGIYRGNQFAAEWERKDIQSFQGRDITAFASYGSRLYAGLLFGGHHWIFSTDNSGESWDISAHEFSWLYDLHAYEDKLWAGREDGLWFIDISGTSDIEDPNESKPTNFVLHQNYPNPFNPSTTIKFTIPNVGDEYIRPLQTSLIVYDILGREIKTLLNEQLQPGEYEIEFDASDLLSGAYFYRLNAGGFSKSRKMLLLK